MAPQVCAGPTLVLLSPLPTILARCVVYTCSAASSLCVPSRVRRVQVKLFKWPCIAKAAACRQYCGHSSHVRSVRFTKSDQYLVRPPRSRRMVGVCRLTLVGQGVNWRGRPVCHASAQAPTQSHPTCTHARARSGGTRRLSTTKGMHSSEPWLQCDSRRLVWRRISKPIIKPAGANAGAPRTATALDWQR